MKKKDTALDRQVGGSHYKDLKVQPVEFITNLELGFIEGSVIKYLCRWKRKHTGAGSLDDLLKAAHYLQILIEQQQVKAGMPLESQEESCDVHGN